jgi:hypothetical protein
LIVAGLVPVLAAAMAHSFHNADKQTHRRVMVVGLLFCAAFVAVSFFLKPQPENDHVLLKADRLVQTAGKPIPMN